VSAWVGRLRDEPGLNHILLRCRNVSAQEGGDPCSPIALNARRYWCWRIASASTSAHVFCAIPAS
jgi:hypothetical protein